MKTYQDYKEELRVQAMAYQAGEAFTLAGVSWEAGEPLSWGEVFAIENYFEEMARRYGLVKEFKENCII